MRPIDTLVIHHSACLEGSVAQFTKEHRARGFGTIGYHYIIGNGHGTPDGALRGGRPEWQKGCGVFGANTGKLHICLVGNFHRADPGYTGRPSRAQLDELGHWLLVKGAQYHIPYTRVLGHKEVAIPGHGTACPGDQFPLKSIRAWYYIAMHAKAHGGGVQSLSTYLEQHDYPLTSEQLAVPKVAINRGSQQQLRFFSDVITKDGRLYVPVNDLPNLMNWPMAEWEKDARQLTIHTGTK